MLPLLMSAALAAPIDPFEEPDEADLFALEERLITSASRYAQTTREAPAIVTVISDRQIRQRGYRTLADALRGIPGIYLSTAPESRTLAFFRGVVGADNNKFLLLVDGVPWYDGIYTHAWIDEYLPLAIVKQIEVIKGPGSAIYGTNAFAGVINVVTYGPQDLDGGFARAALGSSATGDGTVTGGGALGDTDAWVSAYARWHQALGDGIDVNPRGRADVSGFDPVRSVNAGLRLESRGLTLRYDHVDYRHTYFTQEQDDPFDIWLQSFDEFYLDYRNHYLSARWQLDLGPSVALTPFALVQDHDNPGLYAWVNDPVVEEDGSVSLSGALVDTKKHSRRYAGGVDVEARPSAAHVIVGGAGTESVHLVELQDDLYLDFSHDKETPSGFKATPDQFITVPYAYVQDTWTALYWLETTLGVRADYNLKIKSPFVSPRAGLLLVPAAAASVKLLYGRAFRAPNARELLVDQVATDDNGDYLYTISNASLSPERIDTLEGEVTWTPSSPLTLRGAAFYSLISDTIDKGFVPYQYINRAEGTDALGAEAEVGWRRGAWDLEGSSSWTRAIDQASGAQVYEFPPRMSHARATWTAIDGLHVTLMGDRYSYRPRVEWSPNAGLADGPPFGLLHAALSTDALGDGRVRVDLSARNLLDTEYETLLYVDDADATNSDGSAKFSDDIQGEGRIVTVGTEISF